MGESNLLGFGKSFSLVQDPRTFFRNTQSALTRKSSDDPFRLEINPFIMNSDTLLSGNVPEECDF